MDIRPTCVWAGLIVGSFALLVHASMRELHTTFDANGVRATGPGHRKRCAWSDLTDLIIVRTSKKKTGKVVKRSHLDLTFRDGVQILTGRDHSRPTDFWEAPAAFASQQSGLAIRRVER